MLLKKYLKNTDAVLLDVRSNRGGSPEFTEWITQYFKISYPLIEDQVLNNVYTYQFRQKLGFSSEASGMYTPKKSYGKGTQFLIGMLYVKPVGVLVDSDCKFNLACV